MSCTCFIGVSAFACVRAEELPTPRAPLAVLECDAVDYRTVDFDGDGSRELVTVSADGLVTVWTFVSAGAAELSTAGLSGWRASDTWQLTEPRSMLLGIGALQVSESASAPRAQQIVAIGPNGASLLRRGGDLTLLAARARFPFSLGAPRFARVCQDLNGDGRADLVVPVGDEYEMYLNEGAGPTVRTAAAGDGSASSAIPAFRRVARLQLNIRRARSAAAKSLNATLEESFTLPDLDLLDLNGDGRLDLRARRGARVDYYLPDASGELAFTPQVVLDLARFRDSTPASTFELGGTLSMGTDAQLQTQDLDGDGCLDHVISHGRKVWVFRGTKTGPQFESPTTVLKVAEDITALVVAELNADRWADLLIIKVQLPTTAGLLRAFLGGWSLRIDVLGYLSVAGQSFELSPSLRSELRIELPSILSMLRDPESFVRPFEEIGANLGSLSSGDFNGDGAPDVVRASADFSRIEIWHTSLDVAATAGAGDRFAQLLFGAGEKKYDLAQLAALISTEIEQQLAGTIGTRPPSASLHRESLPTGARLVCVDIDGDQRAELLLVSPAAALGNRLRFELVRP
ncbi:MAG: FG-GAP repeat domain-containing protein [Planctomycetota bacterium]